MEGERKRKELTKIDDILKAILAMIFISSFLFPPTRMFVSEIQSSEGNNREEKTLTKQVKIIFEGGRKHLSD